MYYAGKKLQIVNKETREFIPIEVFIAILSNSQNTYFGACCSNTLKFYGGDFKVNG